MTFFSGVLLIQAIATSEFQAEQLRVELANAKQVRVGACHTVFDSSLLAVRSDRCSSR